jgi:hypothetical protein
LHVRSAGVLGLRNPTAIAVDSVIIRAHIVLDVTGCAFLPRRRFVIT